MGIKHTIKRWLGITDLDKEVRNIWQINALDRDSMVSHKEQIDKLADDLKIIGGAMDYLLAQPTNEVMLKNLDHEANLAILKKSAENNAYQHKVDGSIISNLVGNVKAVESHDNSANGTWVQVVNDIHCGRGLLKAGTKCMIYSRVGNYPYSGEKSFVCIKYKGENYYPEQGDYIFIDPPKKRGRKPVDKSKDAVKGYLRKDGTYVKGYRRNGDNIGKTKKSPKAKRKYVKSGKYAKK